MIIFISGFIGSGQQLLAQRLADRLGFHYYTKYKEDTDRFRSAFLSKNTKPFSYSDVARLHIFKRIVHELPLLSKIHKGLVIPIQLHRAEPRKFLIEAAKRYRKTLVIWVDSSDEDAHARGTLKGRQIFFRKRSQQEFEPFTVPPLTFKNVGSLDEATEKFYTFVLEAMKHIKGTPSI